MSQAAKCGIEDGSRTEGGGTEPGVECCTGWSDGAFGGHIKNGANGTRGYDGRGTPNLTIFFMGVENGAPTLDFRCGEVKEGEGVTNGTTTR